MKNLRLEIFNAKKNMTIEQEDIVQILESYVHVCDKFSEKEIIKSFFFILYFLESQDQYREISF